MTDTKAGELRPEVEEALRELASIRSELLLP